MKTRSEQMTSGGIDGYNNYLGEDDAYYKDWLGVLGQSRDSNCLELSNFEVGLKMLGGESETVMVKRFGHWSCGRIEEIYVKPNTPAHLIAIEIEKSLSGYPVLDEDDYSDKQWKAHLSYCEEENHEDCITED